MISEGCFIIDDGYLITSEMVHHKKISIHLFRMTWKRKSVIEYHEQITSERNHFNKIRHQQSV